MAEEKKKGKGKLIIIIVVGLQPSKGTSCSLTYVSLISSLIIEIYS